jgi:protein TonB
MNAYPVILNTRVGDSRPLTPMRARDLASAAVFSIVLIVGVAWYGERTHYHRPPAARPPEDPPPTIHVRVDPDPVEEVEVSKPLAAVDVAPHLEENLAPPIRTDFTMPPEPLHPVAETGILRIPDMGGEGTGLHAYRPSDLDQQAEVRYRAVPVYPSEMKREGVTGEVLVDFIVDTNGSARNPTALRSSNRQFEESACSAVAKWKFKPGRKDGHPVFVHMQVPIVFSLSEN